MQPFYVLRRAADYLDSRRTMLCVLLDDCYVGDAGLLSLV